MEDAIPGFNDLAERLNPPDRPMVAEGQSDTARPSDLAGSRSVVDVGDLDAIAERHYDHGFQAGYSEGAAQARRFAVERERRAVEHAVVTALDWASVQIFQLQQAAENRHFTRATLTERIQLEWSRLVAAAQAARRGELIR